MKITINNNTYEQTKIKCRLGERYLDLAEEFKEAEVKNGILTAKEINKMIDFLVEVFENKFTSTEVKDEMDISEVVATFNYIYTEINIRVGVAFTELLKN